MQERRFLINDQSGRGIAVTLPLRDVIDRWDSCHKNDPEDPSETALGEWLEVAEIGDTFDNLDENLRWN